MTPPSRVTLAAALTGVLVGAAMVSTRVVCKDVSPEVLAFLRYCIGLSILVLPACRAGRPGFAGKDLMAVSVLGIFQFAVLIVLLNYALESLPAAVCALVFSTMPLFTLGLGVLFRKEAFRPPTLAGLVLALTGIGVLLGGDFFKTAGQARDPAALAALLGATVTGAACSILYRPYLQRYRTLPTSALAMAAAVVFLAGLCRITGRPLVPEGLSPVQWANVGFIGLASGVGYVCWLWALARTDASRVVAFQALGPVTAAALEVLILGMPLSWTLVAALVLVTSGLFTMGEKQGGVDR